MQNYYESKRKCRLINETDEELFSDDLMEITESFIKKNNTIYKRSDNPKATPPEIVDSGQAPEASDVQ